MLINRHLLEWAKWLNIEAVCSAYARILKKAFTNQTLLVR